MIRRSMYGDASRIMAWAIFTLWMGSWIRNSTILIHHYQPSAEMLFPAGNDIFQQDNDPKHTAKTVQEYIGTKNWNEKCNVQNSLRMKIN